MSARPDESFGQHGITLVDRLGVWLSQRAIRRYLPKRKGLEVLELGCGYRATQLVALGPILKHGIGIDFQISPDLHALEKFTFHEGTIEETLPSLQDESLDVVMLISVLEHLSDPRFALQASARLLRPGGVVLINVPTWLGKSFLEFSAFRLGLSPKVEMDDHKMYYNKRELWPLLIQAGFRPSQVHLRYHKLGLNLFAAARKRSGPG